MGRAKVTRVIHQLELSDKTAKFINELITEQLVPEATKIVGIRQVGKALSSALSHPVGYLALSAIATTFLIKYGLMKAKGIDFTTATSQFGKDLHDIEERWEKDKETNPLAQIDTGGIFNAWITAFKDLLNVSD